MIRAHEPGQPIVIEATVAPGGGAPLHVPVIGPPMSDEEAAQIAATPAV